MRTAGGEGEGEEIGACGAVLHADEDETGGSTGGAVVVGPMLAGPAAALDLRAAENAILGVHDEAAIGARMMALRLASLAIEEERLRMGKFLADAIIGMPAPRLACFNL
jgi:hypothetical protein